MSTTPSTIAPPSAAQTAKPARRIPWMLLAIITVLVVLALAASYWFFVGRFVETTDDAYVGGDVTVMAPKVNGFVTDVLVKDNQFVHANQVLIRLDSRDYDARLAQTTAEVQSAQAAVTELQAKKSLQLATINEQAAEVRASGAELTRSAADQTRYRELVKDDAVSNQVVERADADLSKAHAAVDRSSAALIAAQRQIAVLDAQIGDAEARIATAQAAQRVAALNVEYTTIRSPIDGYVGNRTARVGLLANTGVSLLTVVPASGLWVDANFKEDQLKKMHVGDSVDVDLDASSRRISGVVESLAPATGATFSVLPAENATGNFTKIVQRVPVRVRLDVPKDMQGVLRPGLSATVKVHLDASNAPRAAEPIMTDIPANPADLPTRTKVLAFTLMCLGFFMATLDIQIVASSLKDIGGGLSASQDELSWVQTSYLIAEILVIPMSGWLTRVFSTRWVFAFSALGFTITSMLCGLAWDINSMILFRGLQGALGAAMIPTVFTTAFVLFPGKQRLIASTTISALATLAPTVGPVIGGWITSQWSWHWLFYLNLVPGAVVAFMVPKYVHFDKVDLSLLKKGDYVGILLMSGFLGCLEYVLEEGPRKNWFGDDVILTCAWITGICGFLFIVHAFTAKEPIVDLRALAIRNFGIGSLLSFITGIGIFCAVFLTPVFLSRVRGFDSLQIGVALLSVGCFQLVAMVAYSIVARFIDMRILLVFGLVLFGVGCYLYVPLTNQWGWQELLIPQALRGIGQQFCIPPIVTMALGSLPMSRLRSASGLFNLMRNLGGAIGIAVSSTMLNDRLNLHYERLDEHLNVGRPIVESILQQQSAHFAAVSGNVLNAANAGLGELHALLMREALVLTFSDTFVALALCFVVGLVSVLFTRPFGNTAPPPDAH